MIAASTLLLGSAVPAQSLSGTSSLPAEVTGEFGGIIERSALLSDEPGGFNGSLGGRVDFRITPAGAATGKAVIGSKAYTFRSSVIQPDPQNDDVYTLSATLTRAGNLAPLSLAITIFSEGSFEGTVSNAETALPTVAIEGVRNPWSKTHRATLFAGYYTLKLDLTGDFTSDQAPMGSGFLAFTVNPKNGKLTLKGRLADGTGLTLATFAGPQGQIPVFRTLYASTTRGSILGSVLLSQESFTGPVDNLVTGSLSWSRPPNLSKSNRLYRDGFPGADHVLGVLAEGGTYHPPPKGERVLELFEDHDIVEVLFSGANVENARPLADHPESMIGTVKPSNKVTFDPDPSVNPRKVKLTFTARTGVFKAQITLRETSAETGKLVHRTVKARGIIVGSVGEGHFILDQLPTAAGETPASTPQQAGKVVVRGSPPLIWFLPASVRHMPYVHVLEPFAGVPPHSWKVAGGHTLPAGFTLTPSGRFSGTPTAPAATYHFTLIFSDRASPPVVRRRQYSLKVLGLLTITNFSFLPDGQVGEEYGPISLEAIGGFGAFTWTINSWSPPLPDGLVLTSGGVITGTPTEGGYHVFSIRVTDSGSGQEQQSTTKNFELIVNP